MPSKPPTAVEELRERIDTLDRQIDRYQEDAATFLNDAAEAVRTGDRLSALRDQYQDILKAAAGGVA